MNIEELLIENNKLKERIKELEFELSKFRNDNIIVEKYTKISDKKRVLGVQKDYENQLTKEHRWYIDPFYYTVPNLIGKNKKDIPKVWREDKRRKYNNIIYGLKRNL